MDIDSVDIQCQRILVGVKELEKLLTVPATQKTLDLENNAHTARNLDLLFRVKHSLNEYTERGKDLLYVGLMGEFSAGKTTTINSLLDTDRPVGLHPTDKDITLITHKDNKSSVIITTRENLVPIRADTSFDDAFLKNIVLADTPGVGDPGLAKEIARDFLPICDYILYFISATSPLKEADVPLLKEKFAQLRFIPIKFVITRSDEFRIDDEKRLDENNFDQSKSSEFLTELALRLNNLLESVTLKTGDFLFIDNKTRFQITELRNFLLSLADPANFNNKLQIHEHKVIYYRSSASTIQEYFSKFLRSKIDIVAKIVATAQQNIDEYQENVRIANNRLTETWQKHLQSIRSLNIEAHNELLSSSKLPASLYEMAMKGEKIDELKSTIEQQASERTMALQQKLKRRASNLVEDYAKRMKSEVAEANANDIKSLKLAGIPFKLDIYTDDIDILPDGILVAKSLKQHEATHKELMSLFRDLLGRLRTLRGKLNNRKPLSDYKDIHRSAINTLMSDFDVFFNNVSVYRSGVFSRRVKEAISKLVIGKEMDDLEIDEFTEDEKESIKASAVDEFFADVKSFPSVYSERMTELHDEGRKVLDRLEMLATKQPTPPDQIPDDLIKKDTKVFHSALLKEIETETNTIFQNIVLEIKKQIGILSSEHELRLNVLRRARNKRFVLFSILTGIVVFLIYIGYFYFNRGNVPSTIFNIIGLSLLANFIGNAIGIILAKLLDKFPQKVQSAKDEYIHNVRLTCNSIIDGKISNFNSFLPNKPDLHKLLSDLWIKMLIENPYEIWATESSTFFAELEMIDNDYFILKEKYLNLVDKMTQQSSAYFENIEHNLDKLREVAQPIKKRAIEPSFKLLADTQDRLEQIKNSIEQIQFS